jgi:hypothetical protein
MWWLRLRGFSFGITAGLLLVVVGLLVVCMALAYPDAFYYLVILGSVIALIGVIIGLAYASLGEPLLCRLGFHKWRNYGEEVEVFWQEPTVLKLRGSAYYQDTESGEVSRESLYEGHSEVVYEGRECTRCGKKLRRRLVTNSDGTLSSVGWEPETGEADEE